MIILQFLYSVYLGVLYLLFCVVQIPFHYLFRLFPTRRTQLVFSLNRRMITVWSWLVFMRIRVEGLEHRDPNVAYMLVGNHANLLDMPVCAIAFRHPAMTMVKAEFGKIPIIGTFMRSFCIMVERESSNSRQSGARALIDALRKGTKSI